MKFEVGDKVKMRPYFNQIGTVINVHSNDEKYTYYVKSKNEYYWFKSGQLLPFAFHTKLGKILYGTNN